MSRTKRDAVIEDVDRGRMPHLGSSAFRPRTKGKRDEEGLAADLSGRERKGIGEESSGFVIDE